MQKKYADIIIDISHEAIDRAFQYEVPDSLCNKIKVGSIVYIPFGRGNHLKKGYVVGLSDQANFDETKIKKIDSIVTDNLPAEGELISLAYYLKEQYGSTMANALKTVMPVKKTVKQIEKKQVVLNIDKELVDEKLAFYQKKNAKAKYRLLEELKKKPIMTIDQVSKELNISRTTLIAMEEEKVIQIEVETIRRNPTKGDYDSNYQIPLNEKQTALIEDFKADRKIHKSETYLLHGVTGSGKTEVYMACIAEVIKEGKQSILLIPEISLTYQTVKRFKKRFGDRVTIMNSKMSDGEKYDQYIKMKEHMVDVVIGPRSALFAPFDNLGLIIIDEEHDGAYKSDYSPKYHARETAIYRASLSNASVILGSATPSITSYQKAVSGQFKLWELKERAIKDAKLPKIDIVDLKEELKSGNKTMFSRLLKERMDHCIKNKEQIMIFINRRGYESFYSCRSCGEVIKCPHCDVALTYHKRESRLRCHYCGYEQGFLKTCPSCHSKLIAPFMIGTEKVCEALRDLYPEANVKRMDFDTTKNKDGHEKLLKEFAEGEIDILVGTQMIVKGHDYKNVTLVGIVAADLSLHASDYMAQERAYSLMVQAAGRAGRGDKEGYVVIQTYHPDHYSIVNAANQDYSSFYQEEIAYRSVMDYPPKAHMLSLLFTSKKENRAIDAANWAAALLKKKLKKGMKIIGPSVGSHEKINDYYRRVIYVKSKSYEDLKNLKDILEEGLQADDVMLSFDFDPLHSY